MKFARLILLCLLATAAAAGQPQAIKLFPGNGQIRFEIQHELDLKVAQLVGPVHGTFQKFRGRIVYDPRDLASGSISWTVDVASIDTGVPKRDKHLASPDYFDAAKYPTISFTSRSLRTVNRHHLEVTGDFTMKGVTRTLTVPVYLREDKYLDTEFSILRSDYGFTAGYPAIGDKVDIRLRVYPSPSWFPVP